MPTKSKQINKIMRNVTNLSEWNDARWRRHDLDVCAHKVMTYSLSFSYWCETSLLLQKFQLHFSKNRKQCEIFQDQGDKVPKSPLNPSRMEVFCHQNQNAKNIGNFTTRLKPHNIGTHLKGIETSFQLVPLFLKSFHFWEFYLVYGANNVLVLALNSIFKKKYDMISDLTLWTRRAAFAASKFPCLLILIDGNGQGSNSKG
jgi:hypothetical protein